MRRVLGASVVVAAVLGAGPGWSLDVCVEGDYPPFSEVAADGTLQGFDIDIAQALCAGLGESCVFVQRPWERLIPALVDGACDAIVASMSDTPDRRRRIDFTIPYYSSPVQFVGADGAGLADTPEAMATRIVGVQRGTVNQTYMVVHYPGTPLRLYGTQEHALLDLMLGRLDAVLGESVQLDWGFLRTPAGEGYGFFGGRHGDPAILGHGAAIGVRKEDSGLRDALSAGIEGLRADGRYAEIAGRYFDGDSLSE